MTNYEDNRALHTTPNYKVFIEFTSFLQTLSQILLEVRKMEHAYYYVGF